MKQKDYLSIAVIVIIATLISAVVAGKVFNSSGNRKLTAPEVKAISSDFPNIKDDSNYNAFFNSNAIDPTQLIKIGTDQNDKPFSAQSD